MFACMCVHVNCLQAVFILVALKDNAFPHLNTTPPILFIFHICSRERSDMAERKGCQRDREVCVCACVWTHTKLEWWELVPADDVTFSIPPLLCSPLPLAEVQQASSHCLLHCNLPSLTTKHKNQLTSFSPLHLFTSAELKGRQARISGRVVDGSQRGWNERKERK